jgi:hypothetical protein
MDDSMPNRKSRNGAATETTDPVSMLKQDHKNVKQLFKEFEDTDNEKTQMQIAMKAIGELKVHAAIEEEIFYPAVKDTVDDEELMAEATEEHHVVHFLINELEEGNLDHETFHAKFIVLAENVRHHIKEEEGEMMPKIDEDKDAMERLGARMAQRKEELMEDPAALSKQTGKRSSGKQATRAGGRKSGKSGSRSPGPRASR